ncbi:2-dehydropantoate 2-reductase [Sphaerochaeta pleomorpha str. Grapes]|uniref:2-dehydropantoate 2-reductase n=1 Tax=Sphaerochaeta pleomorpha (strain ATCC BAA-1885 / DSM 22778 / Grapes) TaxID=158190 RepID=G8QTA4_SPHPG|nr:ketopantoate reductase family protein [Sphaerochaeta pleomorpha]AEV29071.1 2-dehydropantoate 2-reductase [Sphaerochaeta pleomorpha str. Grapes]
MKIAIYGAGSLGIILGAYLTKGGIPVDLINRNALQVEALRQQGAQVVGSAQFTVPVSALLPSEMKERYDLIFLMTKQLDNERVVRNLIPFLQDDGVLCTMQNGLPELGIAKILGESRVLGCTIAWGATLEGPGVSRLTSELDTLTFSLGSLTRKKDDALLLEVKDILEKMGPVHIEENFLGARWVKLLVNSAFSGMATVLGCTFGEVSQNKKARLCAQRIIKECIDVARQANITIEPIQGKDAVKLFDYASKLKQKLSFFLIPFAMKKHKNLKPSMLQDLEAGKPCEVDAINGIVCMYGKNVQVPTPYNDLVVETIHAFEQGKGKPGFENLQSFEKLQH